MVVMLLFACLFLSLIFLVEPVPSIIVGSSRRFNFQSALFSQWNILHTSTEADCFHWNNVKVIKVGHVGNHPLICCFKRLLPVEMKIELY